MLANQSVLHDNNPMKRPSRAQRLEQNFIRDLGIISFDPNREPTPDVLTRPTDECLDDTLIDQSIDSLNVALDSLVKYYSPQKRAIGLAAPQIGLSVPVAVIQEVDATRRVLVNPSVEEQSSDTQPWRIGCLSMGRYRQISHYPQTATIAYTDELGNEQLWHTEHSDVVVPVHEIEHLEGKLLTNRVTDVSTGLFVPREELYGSRTLLSNWAAVVALKRRLDLPHHTQTTEQYYSRLFRGDAVDWAGYVEGHVRKRKELVDILLSETPSGGSLIEAGCGTSALSVYLSKLGYNVDCIDNSPDMLALAVRCNQAVYGRVRYENGDLFNIARDDTSCDVVFSHGVLEEVGPPEVIVQAINEALRVGRKFIFSVPTIWDRSNNLNGTENLWTAKKWRDIIEFSEGELMYSKGSFPMEPVLARANQITGNRLDDLAANVIFVVKRR